MLHVFYGSEPVGRKQAFDELKSGLNPDGALATNTTHLLAGKSSAQEVIAACNTVPFLGEHRLVVVEGLLEQAIQRGKKGEADEEDADDEAAQPSLERWEPLIEQIPLMPPSTTLVLLDGGKIMATNALLKKLKPLGDVRSFPLPDEKLMGDWLARYVKAHGVKIQPAAVSLLAELVGNNTMMLVSELNKLTAYAGHRAIAAGDVSELVSRAKEQKAFLLTDAIVNYDGKRAARLLQELIEDGAVLQVLLSTVAGKYRRIAITKDMLKRRATGAEIARRLGTSEGAVRFLMEQASRMSWTEIRAAYARIIECELDNKQGLMDDRAALELTVQELSLRPSRAA